MFCSSPEIFFVRKSTGFLLRGQKNVLKFTLEVSEKCFEVHMKDVKIVLKFS